MDISAYKSGFEKTFSVQKVNLILRDLSTFKVRKINIHSHLFYLDTRSLGFLL